MHALEECVFSVGFSFGYKDAYIFKIVLYMLLWRRTWQPTSVLLPEKSHGWRGPGRLQSMRSRRVRHDLATSLSLSLSCIGAGNGNPLQCSCLENPRDGGAWWAAIYGVTRVGHDWVASFLLSCIGAGNGNPLQCSCLENPRDGGAWWAAVYGVS